MSLRSLYGIGFGKKNENGKTKIAVLASIFIMLLAVGTYYVKALDSATITTSKSRYDVGETMHISGTGFAPNVSISISVELPGNNGVELAPPVNSDANGAFADALYTPAVPLSGRFRITATDNLGATAHTASTEADAIGYNKGIYKKNAPTPNDETSGTWTTGNAGSNYLEGNWVFYEYQVTGVSSAIPDFDIYYDHFSPSGNAIFIDALSNFRACVDTLCDNATINTSGGNIGMLKDGVPHPPQSTAGGWINAIGAVQTNTINRPYIGTTCTTTPEAKDTPSQYHCFHVNGALLQAALTASAVVPDNLFTLGEHSVTFYVEAHLARTSVWTTGNEKFLGCNASPYYAAPGAWAVAGGPYGTDIYNPTAGACSTDANTWTSSSFVAAGGVPGSSGHFNLNPTVGSNGAITLPIPTTQPPNNHIVITKVTNPSPAAQTFGFTGGLGAFTLDTAATATFPNSQQFDNIAAGSPYVVTESSTNGWALTNLACTNTVAADTIAVDIPARTVTITMDPAASGRTITCTFTNTQAAKLTLSKVCEPVSDTTTPFSFTIATGATVLTIGAPSPIPGGGTLACGANRTLVDTTDPAQLNLFYKLSETVPTGWDNFSIQCVANPGSNSDPLPAGDVAQLSVDVTTHLDPGDVINCEFKNRKRPTLTVNKVTVPSNDAGRFNLTIDGSTAGNGSSVGNGGTTGAVDVTIGAHSVGENTTNVTPATNLTDYTAVISGDCDPATGSVTLAAGENKTCTITNTHKARLRVIKSTLPDADPTLFTFTPTGWNAAATFQLKDNDPAKDSGVTLLPGPYSVAETVPAGWTLSNRDCVNTVGGSAHAFTQPGTGVSLTLAAGEDVTCTFTNTGFGHVVIVKDANPNDAQNFTFTNNFGNSNPVNFDLDDDADPGLSNSRDSIVAPGTYNVSEAVPSGWDQTSATCSDSSPVTAIVVSPGETVTCTFVNTKRGRIIVDKVTNPAADPQSFAFTTTGAGYNGFSLTDAAAANNQEVVPGAYTVAETPVTGWSLVSATCDQGETPASLDVQPGETVSCTFTNSKPDASIKVLTTATNAINDDHQFTITVTLIPNGATAPGTVTIVPSVNPAPDSAVPSGCASATVVANVATCTYTINDAQPGVFDVDASVTVSIGGVSITRDTAGTSGPGGNSGASKTFVDANIQITPGTGVNQIGDPHTLAGHVNVNTGTGGYVNAPAGTTINFSIVSGPGSLSAASCLTVAATGSCTVTLTNNTNDTTPGTTTVKAATDVTVGGVSLHRETGSATNGNTVDAIKRWVNASIKILADATNEVNDDHNFTVTITQYPGTATPAANVTVTASVNPAAGTFTTTNCTAAPLTFVANVATCTLTVNNATAGTFDVDAVATITIDGESVVRSTTGTTGPGGNTGASKTFVDGNIVIGPPTATNPVGAPHVITATVKQNLGLGGGLVAVPNGVTVTFSLSNAGGATAAFVGGNTCLTAGGTGQCSVTINSPTSGTVTINATTTFSVSGVSLTRDTNPATGAIGAGPGGSGPATKIYESGVIIIDKVTNPAGDGQLFTFTPTGFNGGNTFQLADVTAPFNSGQLAPGTFSVAETVPANWDLTSATCNDGSPVTAISLQAGETLTCTFTNTKRGGITIVKEVVVGTNEAATAADDFGFDPSAGVNTNTNFFLDDDADGTLPKQQSFTSVAPGVHTVAELAAPGWDLFSITCNDANSTGDLATRTATINLAPAETVTCTFKNRQAEMPVTKLIDGRTPDCSQPNPNQVPANPFDDNLCTDPVMGNVLNLFGIQLFAAGFPDLELPDDGPGFPKGFLSPVIPIPPVFEPAAPVGVPFTICEMAIPTGWALLQTNDVVFTPTPLPGGFDTTPVVYDPAPSSRNRCFDLTIPAGTTEFAISINNVPLSKILVNKNTLPAGSAALFEFNPSYPGANFFLDDDDPSNDSGFIAGGTYDVVELAKTNWDLTNIVCSATIPAGGAGTSSFTYTPGPNGTGFGDLDTTANITLQNGATATCVFTNTQRGHIIVDKVTSPSGDSQSFTFTTTGTNYSGFSLTDAAAPNDQIVRPGKYSVAETVPANWDQTSATCNQGETIQDLDVEPGETVTCTFNNAKRAHIIVDKVTIPAGDPQSFSFTTNKNNDATNPYSNFSLTDAANPNDQTVKPNVAYQLTEGGLADWDLMTLNCVATEAGAGGSTFPTNLSKPVTQPQTINPAPGSTITCTYTNQKKASVKIVKLCDPDDAQNVFGFTRTGPAGTAQFPNVTSQSTPQTPGLACAANETYANEFDLVPATTSSTFVGDKVYTITEATPPAEWALISLACTGGGADTTTDLASKTATVNLDAGETVVCTYTNKIVPGERFTGGGSFYPNFTDTNPQFPGTVLGPDGVTQVSAFSETRITHGFQLHCNKNIDPNHMEINWDGGTGRTRGGGRANENNFQLNTAKYTGSLTAAACSDDVLGGRLLKKGNGTIAQSGGIEEDSPLSPVDTYEAWGTGRFNNVNNGLIHFMLTDAGEPGADTDEIWVVVYVQDATQQAVLPLGYREVLRVGGNWDAGHTAINSLLTANERDLIVPNGVGSANGSVDNRSVPRNGADIQNGNHQAHKGLDGF
jgi:hypothetical protein